MGWMEWLAHRNLMGYDAQVLRDPDAPLPTF